MIEKFLLSLLYRQLVMSECGFPQKFLWKTKVPSKIKLFLWLMVKINILTKDNLIKRGWSWGKACVFCGQDENIDHLFFQCSVARLIWSLLKYSFELRTVPDCLNRCFGRWLSSFPKNSKQMVLVGESAIFLDHLEMSQ